MFELLAQPNLTSEQADELANQNSRPEWGAIEDAEQHDGIVSYFFQYGQTIDINLASGIIHINMPDAEM